MSNQDITTDLITINQSQDGAQTVNARDLHTFLESKQDFSTWIKTRIEQYGFAEGVDYLLHKFMEQLPSGAKQKIDYHLTLDMAKEISMVERNDKGKQARQYFIACENRLRTLAAPAAAPTAIPAAKEFRQLYGIARLIGCDRNAAAISANQATLKLTGTNVLNLLGSTHLEAEQQVRFFTPTELGKKVGVSGRAMNLLLAEIGLQSKEGEHWVPLPAAEGFFRLFDTGKKHGSGTPITQMKWADGVLNLINTAEAEAA